MPCKTSLLRCSVLLLISIAVGSACFGANQVKFFDLKGTLNERLDQRLQASLKNPELKQPVLGGRGRLPSRTCCDRREIYFCSLAPPIVQAPTPSKNSLPDEPIDIIAAAFQGCAKLQILTLGLKESAADRRARISKDDFYDCSLILKRTETSDVFAMLIVFQWLFETLGSNEAACCFDGASADDEINQFEHNSRFAPNIALQFEGKERLRIELDTEKRRMVFRTKDKWGSYTFDQLSADAIKARVNDLHAFYETSLSE